MTIGLAAGITAAPVQIQHAQEASAAKALSDNIVSVQQAAIATDGRYALSLDALMDGTYFGIDSGLDQRAGKYAYAASRDRKHYIVAAQLPTEILVISEASPTGLTCKVLDAGCIAMVTDSDELIEGAPLWQQIG